MRDARRLAERRRELRRRKRIRDRELTVLGETLARAQLTRRSLEYAVSAQPGHRRWHVWKAQIRLIETASDYCRKWMNILRREERCTPSR